VLVCCISGDTIQSGGGGAFVTVGCDVNVTSKTLSLTLREKCVLRVFENTVLCGNFSIKRVEGAEGVEKTT
jgi:hypothetical protein